MQPAADTVDAALVETVVTTRNDDGSFNVAAIGARWGEELLTIRPYAATRTLRNLCARPYAVVHLTDDVLLFAEAALGRPRPSLRPAAVVPGAVIEDACAWREVEVARSDLHCEPARVELRVLARGRGREPLGLNRARHAVVEASILASRVRWLPRDEVLDGLRRLQPLVDKTAGPRERAAMDYVRAHVARRLGAGA